MIKAKVNIRDINRFASKAKRFNGRLKKAVSNDIAETAINVDRGAKQRAPVRTKDNNGLGGRLRTSIYIEKRRANGLLWEVGVNANYAPYVEFGTGRKVNLTQLRAAGFPDSYAARFKGRGIKKVNIRPQPFFFPSINEETPKMYKRLNATLKKNGKSF